MRRNFWIQVQNYMRKAKFRRKVRNILAMLAVVTVFTTTYALILPAITLENSVPLAGFDANEGKTPEELAAEAERQAAAAAAEGSGNGGVDADPAAFVGPADSTGEGGQNPAADGETPPPTPPDSVEVSGEVSGEFSSDKTDYPSIEGFTMNAEGKVFDAVGNEIDPARLSEAQRQSLLAALQSRTAEEALANYHMNGAGQVLDANEQPVDISGLSPETLKALEQKYIDEVLSLYHMDKDGQILDSLNQTQDPSTFSAAAIVALREKSRSDASVSAGEDSEKEPGSHDLSLYKMQDNGRIVSEDGGEIPAERFSEEELASLKKAWSERVLAEYSIDENGDVKNAEGETVDSSAFPEELLLALRQKAADGSEALPYALKMYMDQDLVIKDGFTHQPVSEEKLNELSAKLRDILYGFEVNYDARLEVKDRYTAGLRAQGLDAQAESVASSAAPMAEAGRQQTLAANARQIAAGEAALDAEVQAELTQVKEQAATAEGGQGDSLPIDLNSLNTQTNADSQTDADSQADAENLTRAAQDSQDSLESLNSLDSEQITLEDLADQQALAADQNGQQALGSAPQPMGAGRQQPNRAPIPPKPPTGLDLGKNTLTQNPPQPYYYYTNPNQPNNSSFVRISVEPFKEQTFNGYSYTYPTGAAVLTRLSFSNANGDFTDNTIRVYVKADQADDKQTGSYNPPGDLTISGITYPVHSVVNPTGKGVLYYYDINQFGSGATGQDDMSFAYPNGSSLGGNTTIWAEKLGGKTPPAPTTYDVNPGPNQSYMNVPHVTEPRQQQVSKSGAKPNFKTVDGTSYVTDLGFTVQDTITGTRRYFDKFGEIRYLHTAEKPDTILDVLTLPDGMVLRDGLAGALNTVERIQLNSPTDPDPASLSNVQGLPASFTYPGSLLTVTINGQKVMLAYFEESRQGELTYAYTPSLKAGGKLQIEAKARYTDPSKPADLVALWNAATPLRYRLGDTLVKLKQEPNPGDPAQVITNDVDYTLWLENKTDQTSHAQAQVRLEPKNPHLTIEKKAASDKAPQYFGEPAGWEITAENDSTYPYRNLKELTDTLSSNLYLSKNDLYELFTAKPGFPGQGYPTVTISGASLVNTPAAASLPNAKGGKDLAKNAQTHGDQTPYDGLATTDLDLTDSSVTLTITRNGDNLLITTTDSRGQSLSKTVALSSLQGIKNSGSFDFDTPAKSFIVTKDAQYRISWPYQTGAPAKNHIFQPGEKHTYQVPTTVKDSFMLLAQDQRNAYPSGTVSVNNSSDGSFEPTAPSDDHSVNGYASHSPAQREAGISKGQTDTTNAAVSQFTVHASHQGTGVPDVLTISDHLKASFASFLVEKSLNDGNASGLGSEVTVDGVAYAPITQPGTYVIGKDQEGNTLTAEVSKVGDTWLVKWHFAKTDISSNFSKDIQVYTYVDPASTNPDASKAYNNEVWMNDHATHRLYDSAQKSSVSDFKKNIVTSKGSTPDQDVLVRSSRLNGGDTVEYRLDIHGKAGATIKAADIYDSLPLTPASFSWTDTNVACDKAKDISSEHGHVVHNITGIAVSAKNGTEPQKLTWTGTDPLITFKQEDTLHIYVKLTFPKDAQWNDYITDYSTSGVDNTFHVFEGEDSVHHMLGQDQLVFMQKSSIGEQIQKIPPKRFLRRYNDKTKQPYYWNSPSYYRLLAGQNLLDDLTKWNDHFSYVTYQVCLFNPSTTENMYLSDLADTLPPGFVFAGFVTSKDISEQNISTSQTRQTAYYARGNYAGSAPGYLHYNGKKVLSPYDYDAEEQAMPVFNYWVQQTSTDKQNPVFQLTNIKDRNGVTFKDQSGRWYLPPQGALSFAYCVLVKDYVQSKDLSDNQIRMKYTPVFAGAQPKYPDSSTITISSYSYYDERKASEGIPNPGTAGIQEDGQDAYLVSNVEMKREPTQIGIKKYYTGTYQGDVAKAYPSGTRATTENGFYKPDEQLRFNVELDHKSGVVQDWTFTETMERPYGFDEIKFYPQGYDTKNDVLTGQNPADLFYKFTVKEKTDGRGFEVTLDRPPLPYEDANTWSRPETRTLSPGVPATFGGPEKEGRTPNFDVTIKTVTIDGIDYQQIQITPEKGYFGYTYDLTQGKPAALHPYPKFAVSTSVHSDKNAPKKTYDNVARLTPSVPILNQAVSGSYDPGNGQPGQPGGPSVFDGELVPVFGSSATGSSKSVTQLTAKHKEYTDDQGKKNSATGSTLDYRFPNKDSSTIKLPNESTPFRYTLRVKNLNEGKYIDQLVMADNLPQQDDRGSWRILTPRQSEFKVNFSDPSKYPVTVKVYQYNSDGKPKLDASGKQVVNTIAKDKYTIQYSDKTTFGRDPDFSRESDRDWYSGWKQSSRSFRIWFKQTGKTSATTNYADALIPPNAVVEVSYDAEIDPSYVPMSKDQTAWNSFGYRYHMFGDEANSYLEAEPKKVGITVPKSSYPSLTKQRLYAGNAYPVTPEEREKSYLFLAVKSNLKDSLDTQLAAQNNLFTNLAGKDYTSLPTEFEGMMQGSTLDKQSYQFYKVPVRVGQSTGSVPMQQETDTTGNKTGIDFGARGYQTVYLMEVLNPRTGNPYFVDGSGTIQEDQATSYGSLSGTTQEGAAITVETLGKSKYPVVSIDFNGWKVTEKTSFTGINAGKPWSINLLKTDGTSTSTGEGTSKVTTPKPLLGALFGLYSPLQSEQMSENQWQDLKSRYHLPDLQLITLGENGKPYYLKAFSDGSALGTARPFNPAGKTHTGDNTGLNTATWTGNLPTTAHFENLLADHYILRELKAPEGYKASTAPILLRRSTYYADKEVTLPSGTGTTVKDNADAWALVSNTPEMGETMPETGGIGRWPFILGGLFFLLVAGAGFLVRRRQAAPETAPQSRR